MQEVSPVLRGANSVVSVLPAPKWIMLWGPDATVESGRISSPYALEEFIPDPTDTSLDLSNTVTPYCYDVSEGGRTLFCKNAIRVIQIMALFRTTGPAVPQLSLQLWGFDWTGTGKATEATGPLNPVELPFMGPKSRSVSVGLTFPLHRDVNSTLDYFTIYGLNSGATNDLTRVSTGTGGFIFGDHAGTDWVPSAIHRFNPEGVWGIMPWVFDITNAEDAIILARAV